MEQYNMRTMDYKYLNDRINTFGDDTIRYSGLTKPTGYQFKVKNIFQDLKNDKIGNDFVSYFGHCSDIFFVLTIHGDFIYSRTINPTHEDIITAEEGKNKIDEDDYNLLSAYNYAFDFMLPAEEYIMIM